MSKQALMSGADALKTNLLGQKLGRKGRDTRERIIAAAERLLSGPLDAPMSLSAVAREASLGMTTLYLYFSDLTELLLAVLEPITAAAEALSIQHLGAPWPDDNMDECSFAFVEAYYKFCAQHARILHLRNGLANANELRMRNHRSLSAEPPIKLLARQMGGDPTSLFSPTFSLAAALFSGLEHMIIIATDVNYPGWLSGDDGEIRAANLMKAEARLLVLGVRDGRAHSNSPTTAP